MDIYSVQYGRGLVTLWGIPSGCKPEILHGWATPVPYAAICCITPTTGLRECCGSVEAGAMPRYILGRPYGPDGSILLYIRTSLRACRTYIVYIWPRAGDIMGYSIRP